MDLISLVLVDGMLFCILMMVRNIWVHRQLSRYNNQVHDLKIRQLHAGTYKGKQSYDEYIQAVWSYDKMFCHFWKWDVSKMVYDRQLYNEVMGCVTSFA